MMIQPFTIRDTMVVFTILRENIDSQNIDNIILYLCTYKQTPDVHNTHIYIEMHNRAGRYRNQASIYRIEKTILLFIAVFTKA